MSKEPNVQFEYDKFYQQIVMKIVADNKVIFFEEVTNDVIDIVREYQKDNESINF